MKKVFAEIIAGVIPHKMTRNRWRGILRYGLKNAGKLKRDIREHKESPRYYLSVCVITKNEGPYFKEWLDWHISQGVEKFYVYDNESTDNTREVLEPYIRSGVVEYNYFPGYHVQLAAYDKCLADHRFDTRWLAVIDMDEFIVPVKDKNIPDYLKKMEEHPIVEVNWLVYGSGGQEKKSPGKVMDRFRKHSEWGHYLNRHVKSIFDPRRVYCMIGCHDAASIRGKAVDAEGEELRRHWHDRQPVHESIRINHYAVKSREEFMQKRARGRARSRHKMRGLDYFDKYDLNDIDEAKDGK